MATVPPATPLWQASSEAIDNSNLSAYQRFIQGEHGLSFSNYQQLHRWSIDNSEDFWESIWQFSGLIASRRYDEVLEDKERFPGARWFPGAELNFAENLLRYAQYDDAASKIAIVGRLENGERRELSYAELNAEVEQLAAGLKAAGLTVGDRVAAFMPNVPETIIAMLAATSLGAMWTSCSPDLDINGVVERFGQLEPKVLFACDGYIYNGKVIDSLPRVKAIAEQIDSIEQLIVVAVLNRTTPSKLDLSGIPNAQHYSDVQVTENTPALEFAQLPFDFPLYLMTSSGTTGAPQCIVHSVGGTLLQHIKEHQLHSDVKPEDTLFYFTTCGGMMWNWLVSGLASGATLVLYDGSPFAPQPASLIDMIDEENISIFGTSAQYIAALEKEGIVPRESHKLTRLKAILSTGSPLSPESFRYVYRDVKSDVCLSSISGGTGILSCFALGNPNLPVYEGELQCFGLGMAVAIFNDAGQSVVEEKGELVCTQAFPACPIAFWADEHGEKFHAAYFDTYPNIWVQGDVGEVTANGGIVIHGRSDVVVDSICIGQQ